MFIKREDAVKRASSLLTRALLINTVITLLPPIYILFSGPIGLHTYAALAFLLVSVASLLLVYYIRRAVEDYSIASAKAVMPITLPISLVGGLVIVGLLVHKARKHLMELQ